MVGTDTDNNCVLVVWTRIQSRSLIWIATCLTSKLLSISSKESFYITPCLVIISGSRPTPSSLCMRDDDTTWMKEPPLYFSSQQLHLIGTERGKYFTGVNIMRLMCKMPHVVIINQSYAGCLCSPRSFGRLQRSVDEKSEEIENQKRVEGTLFYSARWMLRCVEGNPLFYIYCPAHLQPAHKQFV